MIVIAVVCQRLLNEEMTSTYYTDHHLIDSSVTRVIIIIRQQHMNNCFWTFTWRWNTNTVHECNENQHINTLILFETARLQLWTTVS